VLNSDQRLPIYLRLHDELAGKIASQEWRAGEAIPSESDLAQRYQVAVGTLRKTLDLLAAEGLLERIQGKGSFVRRPRFDTSLFRFFRFQNQAGERRIPQSRILSMEATEMPSTVASCLRLPAGSPALHLARLRLMDGLPLLAESIWLPRDRFAALAELRPEDFGDLLYPLYGERCGQTIASAEETLTAEAVGPDHARLLGIEPGSPVMVIERLAFGYDHQPIEWRRSRGPADQFLYTATIR
jgi:GntR family transcriptional regulator